MAVQAWRKKSDKMGIDQNRDQRVEVAVFALADSRRPSLWYIDDEVEIGRALGDTLSDQYEFQVFESPVVALDRLRTIFRNPGTELLPEVIVTDLLMPDMDGMDFIRTLKEIGVDSQVLIASGFADRQRLIKAMDLGVCGVIDKPFDSHQLLAKLASRERRKNVFVAQYVQSLEAQVRLLMELKATYTRRYQHSENELLRRDLQIHTTIESAKAFVASLKKERLMENQLEVCEQFQAALRQTIKSLQD